MTRNTLTFLAVVGCLFALTTSCKDPEDKEIQYATNKAGERLVERIDYMRGDTIYETYLLDYNSDGTLKKIKNFDEERMLSFERKGSTLFMSEEYDDDILYKTSFDLNDKGWITLDRGRGGGDNYRLTYDESGYLHQVFNGEELIWTFEWKEGNIANEEVTYIPTQSHPSNIDWCAFLQSWRHSTVSPSDEEYNEFLIRLPSVFDFWGFSEGYLGNKCKGLVSKQRGTDYTYKFDEDGFLSIIYRDRTPYYKVSYLKK